MRLSIIRKPSVLIIVAALALATLLIFTRDRPAQLERPERAWAVDVTMAARQTLRPTLELFGSVQSPQNAQLRPGIDGLITEVAVLDGQSVTAGQVVVRIDDRDVRLRLQQAEADLLEVEAGQSLARIRLERSRQALDKERELLGLTESRARRSNELFEQNLLSRSDLETTEENLKRQQLAVNQAQLSFEELEIQLTELKAQRLRAEALRDQAALDLERTEVRVPFDGVISDLAVSQGDRFRAGDVMMRLQNPAAIEVRAQIPARYAETVARGLDDDQYMAALVQFGEQTVAGRLVRISGQTREQSGGVDSFVRFDKPPLGLRLGSTVRVYLELPAEPDVIAVPAEALYGRNQLFRLVDNRMQMVEVERVGERVQPAGGTEVLIRSPRLAENDRIVVTKLSNAADGLLTQPFGVGPAVEIESAEINPVEGADSEAGT